MSSENKKIRKLHNKNLLAILSEAQFIGGGEEKRKKSGEFQLKGFVYFFRKERKKERERTQT